MNSFINKYLENSDFSSLYSTLIINSIVGFIYTIQLKKLQLSTNRLLFGVVSGFVGCISFIVLMRTGWTYEPIESFIPLINIRAIAFAFAILTSIAYFHWCKKNIFGYLAIFLGFYLTHVEIANTIVRFDLVNAEFLKSISWIVYAGVVTTLGILKQKQILKNSGITLCLLSVVRIFVYDLAAVDVIYKFIAFIVLGIILMLLSYIYNKK